MKQILIACILLIGFIGFGQNKTAKLTNANVNIVPWVTSEFYDDAVKHEGDGDFVLKKFLKAEVIDELTFNAKLKLAVNFIVADTSAIKKVNGIITLKCKDSVVTFTDFISDGEENRDYSYIGQLPALNQYIVTVMYYEDYDYIYVDKTSGRQTSFGGGIPYLAPNKKRLLVIYNEPYENTVSFTLTAVDKSGFTTIMNTEFKNWMPAVAAPNAPFWGKDGYFYCTAVAIEDKDNPEAAYQYIRIKLL